ncbi:MAG: type VI secretion system lipoprotein TssJ [Geminicoccaceae bacterium]|nr:type VI secretion system lipoprotein TssJ [Geminicoccaceae bacterium]
MTRATRLVLFLLALGPAGCGGGPPPPPPPTVVSLTLKASPDVNPDAAGTAKPVRVRILQLATGHGLPQLDFHALDKDPEKALGRDLKGMEELVLAPGGTRVWRAELPEEVGVVGVVAAYQRTGAVDWRAWREVPRNATTRLEARLDAKGVKLAEASP